MPQPDVHLIGATCADAARLAPIATAMREQALVRPVLLAAGSDPAAVTRTFTAFGHTPDITLPPVADQAEAVGHFDALWAARTPAAVVVRGDGTGSLAGALAAHWRHVPVMHVEAGRRAGVANSSTAAEGNRRLLAQVATVHLAATPMTAMNLLDERIVAGDVLLTGSTAVEAAGTLVAGWWPSEPRAGRLVPVCVAPDRAEPIGAALHRLAAHFADLDVVVVPASMPYAERARLLAGAYLVVTDDDDVPEEALAFGVPVLIVGEPAGPAESLSAGCARMAGPAPRKIAMTVAGLLGSPVRRDAMAAAGNPYGDGHAATRIAQATAALLGHGRFPDPMPARPAAGVAP